MQLSRQDRLLALHGMTNTRDLGGYETKDGKYTRAKRYIRTAATNYATKGDLDTLYDYGVRVQIDLRSQIEIERAPSSLATYHDIAYYHINLLEEVQAMIIPDKTISLSDMYITIIDKYQHGIKEVFDIFLQYPHDTILFNCSVGKDRTGVIAALLLDLAGCYKEDIIKDYVESYENNIPILGLLKDMIGVGREYMLESKPEYMETFLRYLEEKYGSAKGLLLNCGLTEDQLNELIQQFVI